MTLHPPLPTLHPLRPHTKCRARGGFPFKILRHVRRVPSHRYARAVCCCVLHVCEKDKNEGGRARGPALEAVVEATRRVDRRALVQEDALRLAKEADPPPALVAPCPCLVHPWELAARASAPARAHVLVAPDVLARHLCITRALTVFDLARLPCKHRAPPCAAHRVGLANQAQRGPPARLHAAQHTGAHHQSTTCSQAPSQRTNTHAARTTPWSWTRTGRSPSRWATTSSLRRGHGGRTHWR